jgi:hypothetical protein
MTEERVNQAKVGLGTEKSYESWKCIAKDNQKSDESVNIQ